MAAEKWLASQPIFVAAEKRLASQPILKMSQQPSPHAKPSLHLVLEPPSPPHVTLHGPVFEQCTRQEPWQTTSQFPVDVHVTTLSSPTVGAQSLTLVHE